MNGDKIGIVEFNNYTPFYKKEFLDEINFIKSRIKGIPYSIEHIGATSIPGAVGRVSLDILIMVDSINDVVTAKNKLIGGDVCFIVSESGTNFLKLIKTDKKKNYVYYYIAGKSSKASISFLKFKYYLMYNYKELEKYNQYKNALKNKYNKDVKTYQKMKEKYFYATLEQIENL